MKELGGLCVLGTERHESRRIDNQLRGRSGRQGDPGFSQFCVSFEDDLMVRFGTDRAKEILARVGFSGEQSIRNKMLSKSIETAQRRVEGNNFDIRKTLLKYDDVINQQRLIIYSRRNDILDHDSIHEETLETFKNTISDLVEDHLVNEKHLSDHDIDEILETVNESFLKNDMKKEALEGMDTDEIISYIYARVVAEYEEKMNQIPEEVRNEFEKAITLRVIDTHWMDHINTMSHLRSDLRLRSREPATGTGRSPSLVQRKTWLLTLLLARGRACRRCLIAPALRTGHILAALTTTTTTAATKRFGSQVVCCST